MSAKTTDTIVQHCASGTPTSTNRSSGLNYLTDNYYRNLRDLSRLETASVICEHARANTKDELRSILISALCNIHSLCEQNLVLAKGFDRLKALLDSPFGYICEHQQNSEELFTQKCGYLPAVECTISLLDQGIEGLIKYLRECEEAKRAAWQSALSKNLEMQREISNLTTNLRLIKHKHKKVYTERNELKEENVDLKDKLQAEATARAVPEALLNQRAVSGSESHTITVKVPQTNNKQSADVLATRKMMPRKDLRIPVSRASAQQEEYVIEQLKADYELFVKSARERQQADSDRIHGLEADNLRLQSNFERQSKFILDIERRLKVPKAQLGIANQTLDQEEEQLLKEKDNAKVLTEHRQELLSTESQLKQVTEEFHVKQEQLRSAFTESENRESELNTATTALKTAKAQIAAQAATIEDLQIKLTKEDGLLTDIQQSSTATVHDVAHIKNLLTTQQSEGFSTLSDELREVHSSLHKLLAQTSQERTQTMILDVLGHIDETQVTLSESTAKSAEELHHRLDILTDNYASKDIILSYLPKLLASAKSNKQNCLVANKEQVVKGPGKEAARRADGEAVEWLKACEDFIAALTAMTVKE